MAKHPEPGRVKTRLAAAVGADRACALYRAFILDLAERLDTLSYPVSWAYWPPTAPFGSLLSGARVVPQRGRDLGERMAAAIADELAAGGAPVLIVGADVPHVPATAFHDAAQALAQDANIVLGPASDGGYYLIGLRAPAHDLFVDIAWGTAGVFQATHDRATALGLRTHVLPTTFDVDDADGLDALRALIVRGDVTLPRTARLLTASAS